MTERPRIPARAEIEQAIIRIRRSLAQARPGSPAVGAFEAAIERHERMLAAIGKGRE